jgi:hypothetical protein
MPPDNQLSWRAVGIGERRIPQSATNSLVVAANEDAASFQPLISRNLTNTSEPLLWDPVTGAAFADGVLAGLPVFQAVSHIDPFVLKAIESSTADHIHSFPTVHSYVEQHFFAAPAMTSDGWFERLTGYVAEQKAASVLEAAGHHVTFAATANQPVWDLMVDGHPAQIKEGLTGVHAFLLEHPGVPIYTGTEVAAAVKDPMVHGLAGLNSVEIHDATNTSIQGISDTFDPGFHFPFITLALAGYREAKLLFQERTTLERALKNVSLDVAGVGAGAFVGVKAGAFAGAFLGPIGAAIGGLLGAVAGGVAGKLTATKIRHLPYLASQAAYKKAAETAQLSIDGAVNRLPDEIRRLQNAYEAEFIECRADITHRATSSVRKFGGMYEKTLMEFEDRFIHHLDKLNSNLCEQETLLLATIAGTGVRRIVYPSHNDHLRSAIRLWFRRAKRIIDAERTVFQEIRPRTVKMLLAEIDRFLHTYTFQLESLDTEIMDLVAALSESQAKANSIANTAAIELQNERDKLIRRFRCEAETLHSRIADLVKACNIRVSSARACFLKEARAVGIEQ